MSAQKTRKRTGKEATMGVAIVIGLRTQLA
jgi:hypothetical protein